MVQSSQRDYQSGLDLHQSGSTDQISCTKPVNKREQKAAKKLQARSGSLEFLTCSDSNSQQVEQQIFEQHLRDFVTLSDHFVEM